MQLQPPNPISSLLTFTTAGLAAHYPNLPSWAITAFHTLRQPQRNWTPDARALLNMANVPPSSRMLMGEKFRSGMRSEDFWKLFSTEEDWEEAKAEIDLWRLSMDLDKAKEEGWAQWKGCAARLTKGYR